MQSEQKLEQLVNEKFRLEADYTQIQQNESQLVSELTEKYGVGNLDINTGTFTPQK